MLYSFSSNVKDIISLRGRRLKEKRQREFGRARRGEGDLSVENGENDTVVADVRFFSPLRAPDVAPPLFLITPATQARNWLGQYSNYDYNPVTYRIFCYSYFLSLEMRPLKLSRNNVALRVDKFLLEYNHVAQLQILRARVLGAAIRMGRARTNLLLAIIPSRAGRQIPRKVCIASRWVKRNQLSPLKKCVNSPMRCYKVESSFQEILCFSFRLKEQLRGPSFIPVNVYNVIRSSQILKKIQPLTSTVLGLFIANFDQLVACFRCQESRVRRKVRERGIVRG